MAAFSIPVYVGDHGFAPKLVARFQTQAGANACCAIYQQAGWVAATTLAECRRLLSNFPKAA